MKVVGKVEWRLLCGLCLFYDDASIIGCTVRGKMKKNVEVAVAQFQALWTHLPVRAEKKT